MWPFFGSVPAVGWRPVDSLLSAADRVLGPLTRHVVWRGSGSFPPVRITSTDDTLVLTAEVPGVQVADIELSITGDTLTIKGERRPDESVPEAGYHRRERLTGHFARSVTLPERVENAKVSATCTNGVLRVVMPKVPEARTHKVQVGVK